MLHCKKFDNGIRLIVKNMPGLLSVSMGIIVHTGASLESDSEDGISHFIEHMLFKGTENRTAKQIAEEIEQGRFTLPLSHHQKTSFRQNTCITEISYLQYATSLPPRFVLLTKYIFPYPFF